MIALAAIAVTMGVGGALGAATLIARRRWMIVTVRGHSMTPTLHSGERLVVRRWSRGATPAVGDVIVFLPDELGYRIKRVAAIAGDPVPAWLGRDTGACIPAGHVVVRGDNPRSEGSRELGYIPIGAIVARHRADR
jgi:signal peptidase I